jgi:hypothetical protein
MNGGVPLEDFDHASLVALATEQQRLLDELQESHAKLQAKFDRATACR